MYIVMDDASNEKNKNKILKGEELRGLKRWEVEKSPERENYALERPKGLK